MTRDRRIWTERNGNFIKGNQDSHRNLEPMEEVKRSYILERTSHR